MLTKEQENQIHEIYALCSTAFSALSHFYDDYFEQISIKKDHLDTLAWIDNYSVMQDRIYGIYHVFCDALTKFDGIEGMETGRTEKLRKDFEGLNLNKKGA